MSLDLLDTELARVDDALGEKLLGAFNTVQARMQATHLRVEDGWALAWNHVRGDAEVKGSERYLFMPVRQSAGKVVEARRDLSVTVVLL